MNAVSIVSNHAILANSHGNSNSVVNTLHETMPMQRSSVDSDAADIVKRTDTHLFVAYGDILIALNATDGTKVSQTRVTLDFLSTLDTNTTIKALMLYDSRLAVVMSGVRHDFALDTLLTPSILDSIDDFGDIVQLYDISSVPSDGSPLTFLSEHTLQGIYHGGHIVDNIAHIVTTSHVDTYYHLNRHFSRFQARYQGLSDDEYIEEAVSYAESKIIPSFVDRLMDNLNIDRDGSCSNLMHLSILEGSDNNTNTGVAVPDIITILGGLVQITSFDMLADELQRDVIVKNIFVPSLENSIVHIRNATMVMAANGHEYTGLDVGVGTWQQQTFVSVYSLSEQGAVGVGVSKVPGHTSSPDTVNVWDDHLRMISTTIYKYERDCTDINTTFVDGDITVVDGPVNVTSFTTCDWVQVVDRNEYMAVLELSSHVHLSMTSIEILGMSVSESDTVGRSAFFIDGRAFVMTMSEPNKNYITLIYGR